MMILMMMMMMMMDNNNTIKVLINQQAGFKKLIDN